MVAHNKIIDRSVYEALVYESGRRLTSYHYQISKIVEGIQPGTRVLNVGMGAGFVKWYLKNRLKLEFDYYDLDIDGLLQPDFIGSVESIPVESSSLDVVLCCQVLEHLTYVSFDGALSEISRVLVPNGKFVLSLPNGGFYIKVELRLPKFAMKKLMPLSFMQLRHHPNASQHYWELDRKGTSVKKVRNKILDYFNIEHEDRLFDNPYHHFFICTKK